jgi:signal transduction histidine kinase
MEQPQAADRPLYELERRRRVAESLGDILAMLNSNQSLEDTLDYIVQQASPLLGADAAAIYRLQDNQVLTIQSSTGLHEDYLALGSVPLGMLATGRAALELQPVNIPDIFRLGSGPGDSQSGLNELLQTLATHYRGLLSIPLVVRNETYGAMTLYYIRPHQATPEEFDLATSFGHQAALAIENSRLRSRIAQDAITAERTRLARDLHDSVTQMLFSASLMAEVLPSIFKRSSDEGLHGLEELRQLTRGALAEMRTLLLELRPSALEEARLEDLLRQLIESISGRLRIPAELSLEGQVGLPGEVRLAFYRIAQEGLNNIARHADAGRINLALSATPGGGAAMELQDDGCGFDPQKVPTDHLGLSIMKERAQGVGAQIEISSRESCGTRVMVTWSPDQAGK